MKRTDARTGPARVKGDEKKSARTERRIPCWLCKRVVEHSRDGRPTPHKPHLGSPDWCQAPKTPIPDGAPTWPKDYTARKHKPAPAEKPVAPAIGDSARTIPGEIAAWVLDRDLRRCVRCGERHGLELHHVKEWSQGGTHDPDNLETLCGACHAEWTWSATVESYDEWKQTPPGRWFEKLVALTSRETAEGTLLLARLRRMSALEFVAMFADHMKAQKEAP